MNTPSSRNVARRQIVKAVTAGAAVALASAAVSAVPSNVSADSSQQDDDDKRRRYGRDNRQDGGNVFLLSLTFSNWTQSAFPLLPGPPPKNTMVVTYQISANAGDGQIGFENGNPMFVDMTAPAQQIYDQVIQAAKQLLGQLTPAYTVQRSDVFRIIGGFTG